MWREFGEGETDLVVTRLERLERDLVTQELPYEEWEVVCRQKLLVERALLRRRAPSPLRPRLVATLIALAPLLEEAISTVSEMTEELSRGRRRWLTTRRAA